MMYDKETKKHYLKLTKEGNVTIKSAHGEAKEIT